MLLYLPFLVSGQYCVEQDMADLLENVSRNQFLIVLLKYYLVIILLIPITTEGGPRK
jgi:hypothetical protein